MPETKKKRTQSAKEFIRRRYTLTAVFTLFTLALLIPGVNLPPVVGLFAAFLITIGNASTVLLFGDVEDPHNANMGNVHLVFVVFLLALHFIAALMPLGEGMGAPRVFTNLDQAEASLSSVIDHAKEEGYSEILLQTDKYPQFRSDEDSEFAVSTKSMSIKWLYRADYDVSIFEKSSIQLSELNVENKKACTSGAVDGDDVLVCSPTEDLANSMIIKLDANGDAESIALTE